MKFLIWYSTVSNVGTHRIILGSVHRLCPSVRALRLKIDRCVTTLPDGGGEAAAAAGPGEAGQWWQWWSVACRGAERALHACHR